MCIAHYEDAAKKFSAPWKVFVGDFRTQLVAKITAAFDLVEAAPTVVEKAAGRSPLLIVRSYTRTLGSLYRHQTAILWPQEETDSYREQKCVQIIDETGVFGSPASGMCLLARRKDKSTSLLFVASHGTELWTRESADGGKTWTKVQSLPTETDERNSVVQVLETMEGDLLLFLENFNCEPFIRRGKSPLDLKKSERIALPTASSRSRLKAVTQDKAGAIWIMFWARVDEESLQTALFLTRSRDHCKTWEPPLQITTKEDRAEDPAMAVHDGKLFLAYTMTKKAKTDEELRTTQLWVSVTALDDIRFAKEIEPTPPKKEPSAKKEPTPVVRPKEDLAKRFPLRMDFKLRVKVALHGPRPRLADLLGRVETETGLRLTLADNLAHHQPDFGVFEIKTPYYAWSLMETIAEKQLQDGRWEKTSDGYRLTGTSLAPAPQVAEGSPGSWAPWLAWLGGACLVGGLVYHYRSRRQAGRRKKEGAKGPAPAEIGG